MQRQDDYQITRDDMLLFIARLVSLADLIIRIVACGRPVDDRLLASFRRSEHVMFILLGGILGNVDTRRDMPGLDDVVLLGDSVDRHAELLRLAASYRQIAASLALILSMFPRAFRDRSHENALRSASGLHKAGESVAIELVFAHTHSPAARPHIPP